MESIEKLRELAADMNANEIIDHIQLYPSCVFKGEWLDSWHRAFDKELEALEREIEQSYMRLPVDADGVPIREGDIVTDCDDGEKLQVLAVSHYGYAAMRTAGPCEGQIWTFHWDCCRHVKPDPYKELLEEFGKQIADSSSQPWREIVDEYADRLRELGKAGA